MNPTLIYFIKVNIAIALFYLFYRLFFAGDTLWRTRRIYLLASMAVSFLYPLLSIADWLQKQAPMQNIVHSYIQIQEVTITPEKQAIDYNSILYGAYALVAAALVIRLLVQLISILKIRFNTKSKKLQGVTVRILKDKKTPFSFFGNIYINPELHTRAEQHQILIHELTHILQWHSIDVILSEILTIICWINPAAWLLKREIRQNLEFLADDKVIASGIDSQSYQYHLLQLAYQVPHIKITNQFNISPLKKRITMMNQKKSRKSTALKYLLVAPLTLLLVFASNAEAITSKAKEMMQESKNVQVTKEVKTSTNLSVTSQTTAKGNAIASPTVKNDTIAPPPPPPPAKANGDPVFQVVEDMPQFPGGDKALFKFLSKNIKYPLMAMKNKIQGRVICQFILGKDGSVNNVKVVRSVDPLLDAEAVRVIKSMPKWKPGMQRGKPVRVKYTLPINFKLSGVDKNPWGNKPIVFLNGQFMQPSFDYNIIKTEKIKKIEIIKPDTKEKKAELLNTYGKYAGNGVILITTKK